MQEQSGNHRPFLKGNYRPEHLFSLRQAVELYEVYQTKIADCDRQILDQTEDFDDSPDAMPPATVEDALVRMSGVDLTSIDGIDTDDGPEDSVRDRYGYESFEVSETLCLMARPVSRHQGERRQSLEQRNEALCEQGGPALRMAAFTLFNSKSALGAYLRRQRARLGAPKAITATAHKLARLIYAMLTHGTAYADAGQDYYEERYRLRVVQNLKRRAQELGYELVTMQKTAIA